jgi:hypothetical protein
MRLISRLSLNIVFKVNYGIMISVTSFYYDAGELISTCEEREVELNVNFHSNAVATFDIDIGLSATVKSVSYEVCTIEECDSSYGPGNKCNGTQEHLFRRLSIAFDIEKTLSTDITNIYAHEDNCYGFASSFSIDNEASTIVISSACLNMLIMDNANPIVDCDTFKTCNNPMLSDTKYDFTMEIVTESHDVKNMHMDIDVDWTQCPEYAKAVRDVYMDSSISFFKGQFDNSAVYNPSREYSISDELVITMDLPNASISGAHNLRIESVKVCLLDNPTAVQLSCILHGVGCDDNVQKGCQKFAYPTLGNPFLLQYVLLKNFLPTQHVYESSRCKSADNDEDGSCSDNICSWTIEGKNSLNSWDAFRIVTGPFLKHGGSKQWIVDIVGDIEFCDHLVPNTKLRAVQRTGKIIQLRNSWDSTGIAGSESVQDFTVLGQSLPNSGTPYSTQPIIISSDPSNDSTTGIVALSIVTVVAFFSFLVYYMESRKRHTIRHTRGQAHYFSPPIRWRF